MGALDQINQMKNQGMADEEIITRLKEQGISPREINDSLSQSQIKNAVTEDFPDEERIPSLPEPHSGYPQSQDISTPMPAQQYSPYAPQTQEISGEEVYAPEPQQGYYPPQESYQENYEGYPSVGGTDTMMEVAEQVFSEKTKKMQKQIEIANEFRNLAQTQINNISERLQRIETMIDKLQITILEKVGSYGKGLEIAKKEMTMMQNSFGKIVNNLADKAETKKRTTRHKTKKTSKKK